MEEIKREVIKKHLEGWERDLRNTSIEYFAKSGKVSGSFFMALKDMLDDYVEQLRIHDVVGQSEQLICPCCGSDKTYKTDAIHCNRCAITTDI